MKSLISSMESAQNSFVPSLNNEDDSPELVAEKWKYRMARWNEITKQQFQLSYFGTIPYDISNEMSIYERERLFDLLKEQKDAENKAREEAAKQAKANRAAAPKPRRRPRRR